MWVLFFHGKKKILIDFLMNDIIKIAKKMWKL